MPCFSAGDFLANGKTQIIVCSRSQSGGDYYVGFMGIEDEKNNKDIQSVALAQLRLIDVPECILNGDFDGDGLLDILVIANDRADVYWNRGWDLKSSIVFHPSTKTSIPQINTNCAIIRIGDFDGDGVSDILYNVKGESTFNIVKNKGNRTFSSITAINLPEIYDITDTKKDDDKFCVEVTDFNCDGKADVLISKAMFKHPKHKSYYRHSNNYDFWLQSEGDKFTIAHKWEWDFDVNRIYHQFIVGDFNGDGYPECMRVDVDDKWYMYYPFFSSTAASNYNKVTHISQNNGAHTN